MSPHEPDKIYIRGAREHNLKNITVALPRNQLCVITGLSGSGKSSLAFDTLYAEGQRRYVESLSAYARQFLGLMEKPDVETIEGLSPAISIEQKATSRNPRSTVATVTEIYDYLRLLFARIGIVHCPSCGDKIEKQTVQQIVDTVLNLPEGEKLQILAPVIRERKGEYKKLFKEIERDGYVRVRVDGEVYPIEEVPPLNKKLKHSVDVVVDRLKMKSGIRSRLTDSIETALTRAEGLVIVQREDGGEELFSEHFACHKCGISMEEPAPRSFSFNSPFGACPDCDGLGFRMEIDPRRIVPHEKKSIKDGAVESIGSPREAWYFRMLEQVAEYYKFSLDTPWEKLPQKAQDIVLYGSPDKVRFVYQRDSENWSGTWDHEAKWEGTIPNLQRRYKQTNSNMIREWIEEFMGKIACDTCGGRRLKPESLSVLVSDHNIYDITSKSIRESVQFFDELRLNERDSIISEQILKEVKARLGFLLNVGLGYLTLHRTASTLSGGEAQRIRLATQIGSQLVGVLYILDEPSIGLHQRDNARLISTLKRLRDLGNTVIVVEHDKETIEEADWVVDLGPGAGRHGGEIVAEGTPADIERNEKSLTGRYLSGAEEIAIPDRRRKPGKKFITVKKAYGHNLKNVTVKFPLGLL
ncbi:excinuclease ABC subunit UvrA, partial [bacterium]|nr:excinuclease ABC subunit UvrA [bacterium]